MKELYTIDELADFLRVSPRTIRRYLKDGKIKGFKVNGKAWRFSDDEVARFIKEQQDSTSVNID